MGYDLARYKHAELTGRIIKTFYDVYNELGFGFLESVCREALCIALSEDGLSVQSETAVTVWFRRRPVGLFRADIIVEARVIIELKSARAIDPAHEAQLLNYLRATDIEVGLLLNFGPVPGVKRLAFDNRRKSRPI